MNRAYHATKKVMTKNIYIPRKRKFIWKVKDKRTEDKVLFGKLQYVICTQCAQLCIVTHENDTYDLIFNVEATQIASDVVFWTKLLTSRCLVCLVCMGKLQFIGPSTNIRPTCWWKNFQTFLNFRCASVYIVKLNIYSVDQ